ncbi:MAG: glycosyltransferase family 2 protein [Bacteroidales bacterium]|nr:glycosyltransferase family 2 protein [Bacteroidales bacterium]
MTDISIVILNWNGKEYLERFLPSLEANSDEPGVEIIVADNNSADDSLDFLKEHYKKIKIIRLEKNYGFAGGYNRALEQVNSKYFLLLNSDIEVSRNWLKPLHELLEKNDNFAACSPVLLDYNNRNSYEYAGAAGGYIDKFGYTFCRGRIFNSTEPVNDTYKDPMEVFWITGACMLIRADVFKKSGGFDDHFFAHMEEVDLCWRLKNKGYRFAVVPESRVYHVGGGTLPKHNPYKTFLNFRNNLFLIYKNAPEKLVKRIIKIRLVLDFISSLMYIATFNFKDAGSIWTAHRAFRSEKTRYRNFRETNRSAIVNADHPEIYTKSVVFDYFIAGRKKFITLRGSFGQKMNERIIKSKK